MLRGMLGMLFTAEVKLVDVLLVSLINGVLLVMVRHVNIFHVTLQASLVKLDLVFALLVMQA